MAPLHNRASPRPAAAYVALACALACTCLSAVMAQPAYPPPPSPRPPPTTRIAPVDCADLATPQVVDTAFFDASFTASGTAFDCAYFVPTTLADGTAVSEYNVAVTGSNPNGFISIYASNAPGAAPLLTLQANDTLTPIKASNFNVSDGMFIVVGADADATGDFAVLVTTVANCTSPLAPVSIIPLALGTSLLLTPPLAVCINPDAVLAVGNGLVFSTVFDTTLLPASYASTFITTFAADLSGLTGCYQAVVAVTPTGVVAEVFVVFNVSDPSVNSIVGSEPTEICVPIGADAGLDAILVTSIDATNIAANATGEPVVVTLRVAPTLSIASPPAYGAPAYGAYPPAYGVYPPAYGTPAPPPFRIQGGEVGAPTPTSGATIIPSAASLAGALFVALMLLA
ncbi:hypothetical protein FOA52_000259 [Chlamydomonas sp. UWO 241]|nr:hypothetical protein FOA52_000259 [Chlamydomonas sp. UWO 241]